jgi:hypothetical protein
VGQEIVAVNGKMQEKDLSLPCFHVITGSRGIQFPHGTLKMHPVEKSGGNNLYYSYSQAFPY